MRSLDDMPYAVIGAVVGAVLFMFGTLFVYRYDWQLVAAPVVGAILGYLAGVWTLKDRKLPIGSTLRDFKTAMK
jgi:uncharacterized membrane protein YfcA